MDAKCPKCDRIALFDETLDIIRCDYCSFESTYDAYIETMKERTFGIVEDYVPTSIN